MSGVSGFPGLSDGGGRRMVRGLWGDGSSCSSEPGRGLAVGAKAAGSSAISR